MKTAEEWFRDIENRGGFDFNDEAVSHIEQIQLAAMKQGMRRAAEEVKKNMEHDRHTGNDNWQLISKENMENILTAAEQLTEKDL